MRGRYIGKQSSSMPYIKPYGFPDFLAIEKEISISHDKSLL